MKKKTYKRIVGITAAALCSGGFVMSALADDPAGKAHYEEGPASNLWLSVVELPSQAKISVTVPVSYGFAVVGTVDGSSAGAVPVTSAGGMVLLSNVHVEVTSPSTGNAANGTYTITTKGAPQIPMENRSTDVREEDLGKDNPPREGLPVAVKPYVVETPDTLIGSVTRQHYWKPVGTDPTGDSTLFKRYRMGLDGKWFDTKGTVSDGSKRHDAYFLGDNLMMAAPPDVLINGWDAGGKAKVPAQAYFDVDVQVGGLRNQYNQVEQSVKVGQIGWEIIPGNLPDKGVAVD